MATEKLKFKLELYATMWDRPPHAEIMIDNNSYYKGDITGTEDSPNVIEFEHEFKDGKDCELKILRSGKNDLQTVVKDGNIIKDQLLHIKYIEIDEIDIGGLVFEGVYTPIYPEPWATQQLETGNNLEESFKNVTHMGFNGTWKFKFKSPFYMWLLDNLY
jgi:hypothetical protein